MRTLFLLSAFCLSTFAQDILYVKDSTHAFLPKNGTVNMILNLEAINDTIDIFKVKESEINNNTANYDSLGDMTGVNLELSYAFLDNFYLHTKYNRKDIGYLDSNLINNKFDIFLRYQVYANKNHAFAIDGGFELNKAEDMKITNLFDVNSMLNKVSPGANINNNVLTYNNNSGTTSTAVLTKNPYLSIIDTQDSSFYIRGIYSYKIDDFLLDLFAGYKQIEIETSLDSSIAHEPGLTSADIKASSIQARDDGMLFAGIGLRNKFGAFFTEFSYKYNKMLRIDGLEETLSNHIIDLNVTYPISNTMAVFVGGKIMTNQFNGEIPYLYNQYSQSSFDHKYGYASTGLIVKF